MGDLKDFIIENGVLTKYVGEGGDVVIPEGVTHIGSNAFYGNNKITSITVCDGVEHIGEYAFGHCRKVKSLSLPDTVKTIEKGAFYYCDSLVQLKIPENAQIGKARDIVENCFHLNTLILPNHLDFDKLRDFSFFFTGCNWISILVCPSIKLDDISKSLQSAALGGFVHYRERFVDKDIYQSYISRLFRNKDMMLRMILKYDDVFFLQLLVDKGKITAKNIDTEYLEPAIEAKAVQCIQYLLNWKNVNVKPEDDIKAMEKELNAKPKDPYNATDMKKIWSSEKLEDGTLSLTSYKANEEEIETPVRIGKNEVSKLGDYVFSVYMYGGQLYSKKRKPYEKTLALEKIRIIRVHEGVKEIGLYAFLGCTGLKELHLPATVSNIGKFAFREGFCNDCKKVTFHAPTGSYAEQYAKENNIPFVAEK